LRHCRGYTCQRARCQENSQLPETQAIAERMLALASGPPVFHDLEVLEDRGL
jgi:hypothetical protein